MVIENTKNNTWRGRIIRYAPLVLWALVIFTASSTAGASQNTSMFIGPLLKWFFPNESPEALAVYHGYIRKLAHFTEYGILAFLGFRAYAKSSVVILTSFWPIWSFLTVAVIASADEYNQSLNPARTGSVYDVLIDCAGGATVILVLMAFSLFSGKSRSPALEATDR
jgi:VanZ family protein